MLYTRGLFLYINITLLSLFLSGCANPFVSNSSDIVTDSRTARQVWNDNNIEFEAAALSNKSPFAGKVRITANSFKGKVVLIGQAPDAQLNQQITQRVQRIPGVKKVYNQMRIQPMLTFPQMSEDSWITTKVKSAFLAEKALKGVSVKVITENSEVFLFGYITPKYADIATETARNVSGVKLVVRGFEIADVADTSNATHSVPSAPIASTETQQAQTTATPANPPSTANTVTAGNTTDDDTVVAGDVVVEHYQDIEEQSY
ncbi:BON domain-containing protein [Vibrio rarus]|uniref:BON domain-containing protein n=1 Tax=Vibrio rarus TaxID=413403 RepID=UPI0021C3A09E|nr:BON domain-containing protein [Vibrio rarus]